MSNVVPSKKRGRGRIVVLAIVALLLAYQFSYYLTYRSVVDSYGLGEVSFPDKIAIPFFAPARAVDEKIGLGDRIREFSKSQR